METTYIMIKPDGVQRGLISEIIGRFERKGLKLVGLKAMVPTEEIARAHYDVHKERPFYGELVDFMTSGPAVPMVLERADAVPHLREFIGPTNSNEAPAGTIRGDFGTDVQCNAVHASDSPENAAREIDFFFGE